jgi:hypothetical protein
VVASLEALEVHDNLSAVVQVPLSPPEGGHLCDRERGRRELKGSAGGREQCPLLPVETDEQVGKCRPPLELSGQALGVSSVMPLTRLCSSPNAPKGGASGTLCLC